LGLGVEGLMSGIWGLGCGVWGGVCGLGFGVYVEGVCGLVSAVPQASHRCSF